MLQTHYKTFDGFVILHGTDTMSYTASALSFMLEYLGKPVVLTGSQVFSLGIGVRCTGAFFRTVSGCSEIDLA